jgi:hypothetical protein
VIRPQLGVLLFCVASCSRAPAPPEAHAGAAKTRARARASAPGPERHADAPLPALDADGCAADFVGGANPEASLTELARLCAAGMRPLAPKRAGAALRAGERGDFDFEVHDATRCVRGLAAFAPALRGLELELIDTADRSYGRVARDNSFALIGARGPVCLPAAGRYRVTARAEAGEGAVVVELYQVE